MNPQNKVMPLMMAKDKLQQALAVLDKEGFGADTHIGARIQCGIDLLRIEINSHLYELTGEEKAAFEKMRAGGKTATLFAHNFLAQAKLRKVAGNA